MGTEAIMKSQLETMRNKWKRLNIERYFPKVHHFSSDKFKSEPSSLDVFYKHCVSKEIEDENLQTINRAIEVTRLYESGVSILSAIREAWNNFPLSKR
jgi:hypothetical protein